MSETIFKIIAYIPNISFLFFILFLVLRHSRKQLTNIYFSYIVIAITWWLIFLFIADNTSSYNIALFAVRAGMLGPLWIPPIFYLFSIVFPMQDKKINKIEYVSLLPAAIMTLLVPTGYNVVSVKINSWGVSADSGLLYYVFFVYFLLMIVLATKNFIYKYKNGSSREKSQIVYVLSGFIITALSLLVSNVILVGVGVSQYGVLGLFSIWFFVGFTGYAIIRHGLFDVRLIAVRTLAYTLSLATLSIIYYYLAYIVSIVFFNGNTSSSVSFSPINIALALLLAFMFQPVKRFFDKTTNSFFYKGNYNTDDFFARLNKSLTLTTDLRGLLERAAYEIGHTLKSEQVFFFINTDYGHYVSAGTSGHKQLPKGDVVQMEEFFKETQGVTIAALLDTDSSVRRMMLSHRVELMLPLIQDDKLVGYLCLGDHLSSGYTNRDIKALNTISNELVIAIQNALSVQEVRELNATLQQRVDNATKELRASNIMLRRLDKVKDEFVSIASHQLRTPLTSVKGYISMVLDGDAGEISDSQRHLLDEAFVSSERMVHLINDFLNVSRLQTGKFIIDKRPADLSKIVEQEINSLQPTALSRNLKYVYRMPKNFPILDIDEGKIRQVVMNFADNSLYYSNEHTKIIVSLSIEGENVLFTVKDTGIGVPLSEQSQLFGKFYRASNAKRQRPDGTGVGLFLAKKVIDAHGGEVVFESVEGEGSTFGFRLPIKSLESTPVSDTNNLDN